MSIHLYDLQTARIYAQRAGIDPRVALKQYAASGYSRAYLNELAELARQARMKAREAA